MAYDVGDRVKIWKIRGHPVGTIQNVNREVHPLKYHVHYFYSETGDSFTEEFEAPDLALYEKDDQRWAYSKSCTCGVAQTPSGGVHRAYCKLAGEIERGKNNVPTKPTKKSY